MPTYTFEGLKAEYSSLLKRMKVTRQMEASTAAARLYEKRARYINVEKKTGVPWRLIAVLHNRESGANFDGVLHNGEHIIGKGKKTKLVPAGRGPFETWEEAAVDALKLKGFDKITDWSRERMCFCAESFNGFGYRQYRGIPSPYLWAGSNIYVKGKYVKDHKYDPNEVDRQLGCIVVLDRLALLGEQVIVVPPPDVEPVPKPASKSFLQILADVLSAIFRKR